MVIISVDVTLTLTPCFDLWHVKSLFLTGPDLLGKDLYNSHMFDYDAPSRLQGPTLPLADFEPFVAQYLTLHISTHEP
jgi:hypothetical protein